MNENPWAPVWALIERSGWQAVQVFIAAFLLGGTVDLDLANKGILAGIAAAITVLANGVPGLAVPEGLPFFVDLLLRVVRTFVSAFLAPIAAMAVLPIDISTWKAAAMGGIVAALAVIKGAVASHIGASTAATLPADMDVNASLQSP